MKQLNIACGNNYQEGWVNTDKNKTVKADKHFNLEKKWDLPDNEFDFVKASHIIEHIVDLDFFMTELYRVCRDGAVIEVVCPHWLSKWAWGDPDHKRAITDTTLLYYSKDFFKSQPKGSPVTPPSVDVDFFSVANFLSPTNKEDEQSMPMYELPAWYFEHTCGWNANIYYKLICIKSEAARKEATKAKKANDEELAKLAKVE